MRRIDQLTGFGTAKFLRPTRLGIGLLIYALIPIAMLATHMTPQ